MAFKEFNPKLFDVSWQQADTAIKSGDIEGGKALLKNCFKMVTEDAVKDLEFMDNWEDMAADVLKLFEQDEQ